MIASCAAIGLDYERVSLGEYLEAVEAYNEPAGDKPTEADPEFKAFMQGIFGKGRAKD